MEKNIFLLTQHETSDQVKNNEMGKAYKTYRGQVNTGFWVGKPEGERPFGRPRRRWQDNVKMDLQETEWRGIWTLMVWRRTGTCVRAVVKAVTDLRVL